MAFDGIRPLAGLRGLYASMTHCRPAWTDETAAFLWQRLGTALLVMQAVLVGAYVFTAQWPFDFKGELFATDFSIFWTAARAVTLDRLEVLYHPGAFSAFQEMAAGASASPNMWVYPPHALPLIAWSGLLPYGVALAAWTVLGFAAFAAATTLRLFQPWRWMALLALLPASGITAVTGQTSWFVGALLIAGIRLLGCNQVAAGIMFGLLTVKPQFGLLIPVALLALGAWRAILWAGITAAAMIALSLALFGTDLWSAYFHSALPYQVDLMRHGSGLFTYMVVSPPMAARHLGLPPFLGYAISALLAALAIAGAWRAFRRPAPDSVRLAVIVTATFLVTPYAHVYDMVIVGGAVLHLLHDGVLLPEAWRDKLLAMAVLMGPLFIVLLNALGLPIGPIIFAALLWRLCTQGRNFQPLPAASESS